LLDDLPFSTAIYDEEQQLLKLTLSKDEKYRLFTPLTAISPKLIDTTLNQEDHYFFLHFGVNPISLVKAMTETYLLKSRRVGASTISMQVARLKYGIYSKKPLGKLIQILRALQLERHYTKKQILEAYLNLAPYGGNIEGVGAASLIYFNKQAEAVNLAQALTLSIIPQNPNLRTFKNPKLISIRNAAFTRWINKHPQDSYLQATMNLPLSMRSPQQLPLLVPHLSGQLSAKFSEQSALITTINLRMQTLVEKITRLYLQRKKQLGVSNAAILLVDTRDMSIKSLLGSADFSNSSISGQINGTEIKRSPGSTLKPFIYGLALDQGLIHPYTVLKDVPQSFGSYNPENFDYNFIGPIKAKDALVLSRNIPAIYLASQLQPGLFQILEQAEISKLKPESHYGLALSLGGVELTMRELVSLYAMLVNNGIWRPLHSLKNESANPGVRMLSPEASYLVLDMLKDPQNAFPVSWKTGTSSGYRDAWSVGVFGPYALGVWIGNFNNQGNPALVGKDIAAPLFFELIEAIKQEFGPLPRLDKNPNYLQLEKVAVCKASGMLPTRNCKETEETWFIPGKSPIKTDTIFREVAINPKTGLRTCHIDEHTMFQVYEFWPSDLLKIFKQAGVVRQTPPPYEQDCSLFGGNSISPHITSPQKDLHYIIRLGQAHNNFIPLNAVSDADVKTLYWFVNESFIGKTSAGLSLLWPGKAGQFVIRVVDDHGLSDVQNLVIETTG
jgi:penicillin-binding protein 1C